MLAAARAELSNRVAAVNNALQNISAVAAVNIDDQIQKAEADIVVLERNYANKQSAYVQEKQKADAAAALIAAQQQMNQFLESIRSQGVIIGSLDLRALWGNTTAVVQAFNNLVAPIIAREQQNLTVLQGLQRALIAGVAPGVGFVRDMIIGTNVMDAVANVIATEEQRLALLNTVVIVQVPVVIAPATSVSEVDLTGYTLTGVILPAGATQGIGVEVIAQYANAEGKALELKGSIKGNGIRDRHGISR